MFNTSKTARSLVCKTNPHLINIVAAVCIWLAINEYWQKKWLNILFNLSALFKPQNTVLTNLFVSGLSSGVDPAMANRLFHTLRWSWTLKHARQKRATKKMSGLNTLTHARLIRGDTSISLKLSYCCSFLINAFYGVTHNKFLVVIPTSSFTIPKKIFV